MEDNERIFDALCAGACGYLLKKAPLARLLESIRDCPPGDMATCGHAFLLIPYGDCDEECERQNHLSPRRANIGAAVSGELATGI